MEGEKNICEREEEGVRAVELKAPPWSGSGGCYHVTDAVHKPPPIIILVEIQS